MYLWAVKLRAAIERLAWQTVLGCFGAYGLVVAVNASLRLSAIWGWPFWWLWIFAGVGAVALVTWIYLASTEPRKREPVLKREPHSGEKPLTYQTPRLESGTRVQPVNTIARINLELAEEKASEKVFTDYTVVQELWATDCYAQLRKDGRWWVFRSQSEQTNPLGWMIEDPADQTWEVNDWLGAHVGWYHTQDDALRGLRESWQAF